MELRHLRYFVRAAELLHFTHAAESLYVSQPTLSTHIQQLEDELGLPLFERTGRQVRLTEAGKIFMQHSQKALREIELAQEDIADLKGMVSGTLRIASLLTFGQEVLPTWIAAFHAEYPEIHIIVETGTSDYIEAQLQSGKVDLALSFLPPTAEHIEGETLFIEEVVLVVSAKHPLADREEIDLEVLNTCPLAMVSRRWAARRIYDAFMARHNLTPNVVVEIDDLHALMRIAESGHAAVLIARFASAGYPHLRRIKLKVDSPKIHYGILWHSQAHLSPPAKAFIEHIKKACSSKTEVG